MIAKFTLIFPDSNFVNVTNLMFPIINLDFEMSHVIHNLGLSSESAND